MKFDKIFLKELDKKIKEQAKKHGFKRNSGFLYLKNGENFVDIVYTYSDSCRIAYDLNIKKYSYDDIFWDIINMPENKKEPMSLRARGAFAAPSIIVKDDSIPLSPDMDDVASSFCEKIAYEAADFLNHNDVNEYVLSKNESPTLKCLAYIDKNEISSAIKIAKDELKRGELGDVQNEGLGFFEWLLRTYDT